MAGETVTLPWFRRVGPRFVSVRDAEGRPVAEHPVSSADWLCRNCHLCGQGDTPEQCPACSAATVVVAANRTRVET